MSFWDGLTAPQATVIASVMTLVTGVLAVLLGWWLFSGRVKDLKSAVDATERLLTDHKSNVESALTKIASKIAIVNEQFVPTLEGLGQLRASVDDLQSASEVQSSFSAEPSGSGQIITRDTLRDDWAAIRDRLEQLAAKPDIDGRTRAKYARVDRRKYIDLINLLDSDGNLTGNVQAYREAVDLWHVYRNGRRAPSAPDVDRMARLRREICVSQ